MENINSLSAMPTEGKVVLVVAWDTAPCKKFINTLNQAIGHILSKNEKTADISYFKIPNTNEVKQSIKVSQMPSCIIYQDGVEKKRFGGHWCSMFDIAGYISGAIQ